MSYVGSDFSPTDPGEIEAYSFDFARLLGTGETISSSAWSIVVVSGVDASPSSRLIGSAHVTGSVASQLIGNCLGGVTYLVTATVTTSTGQTLALWSHLACVTPS